LKKVLALILVCVSLFGFFGCGQAERQEDAFCVVTSFYPVYISVLNITKDVPGVQVENMAGQQAGCLHDYQLQSSDMQEVEKADVFVINGAGMESFLDKVTKELPNLTTVDASAGVTLEGENSHVWVSISGCIAQVQNIAAGLAEADPTHAALYQKNADAYIEKLEALKTEMHAALDPLPQRDIITMHEAFPYFAAEFDLHIAAVVQREPDSQPSAKEIAPIRKY